MLPGALFIGAAHDATLSGCEELSSREPHSRGRPQDHGTTGQRDHRTTRLPCPALVGGGRISEVRGQRSRQGPGGAGEVVRRGVMGAGVHRIGDRDAGSGQETPAFVAASMSRYSRAFVTYSRTTLFLSCSAQHNAAVTFVSTSPSCHRAHTVSILTLSSLFFLSSRIKAGTAGLASSPIPLKRNAAVRGRFIDLDGDGRCCRRAGGNLGQSHSR